ncbi:KxYKxGKxW signal peptide domain-containing protein [Leuconostoc inhae]|uniref:KxYKxGKxW signal peptide domain-containing protein n=1 Tax=Leuconostoc inhae TaxID=178001 RepID=UPI001C7D92C6|nr:KxYKxGKxW signal peptide domain-containing protein [Leuconostoc inhae]
MEQIKNHYKMYKKGKHILFLCVMTSSASMALLGGLGTVQADISNSNNTEIKVFSSGGTTSSPSASDDLTDSSVSHPTANDDLTDNSVSSPNANGDLTDSNISRPSENDDLTNSSVSRPTTNDDLTDSSVSHPTTNDDLTDNSVSHPTANDDLTDNSVSSPNANGDVIDSNSSNLNTNGDLTDSNISRPSENDDLTNSSVSHPTASDDLTDSSVSHPTASDDLTDSSVSRPTASDDLTDSSVSRPTTNDDLTDSSVSSPNANGDLTDSNISSPTTNDDLIDSSVSRHVNQNKLTNSVSQQNIIDKINKLMNQANWYSVNANELDEYVFLRNDVNYKINLNAPNSSDNLMVANHVIDITSNTDNTYSYTRGSAQTSGFGYIDTTPVEIDSTGTDEDYSVSKNNNFILVKHSFESSSIQVSEKLLVNDSGYIVHKVSFKNMSDTQLEPRQYYALLDTMLNDNDYIPIYKDNHAGAFISDDDILLYTNMISNGNSYALDWQNRSSQNSDVLIDDSNNQAVIVNNKLLNQDVKVIKENVDTAIRYVTPTIGSTSINRTRILL